MCPARLACLAGGDAAALAAHRPVRVYRGPGAPPLAGTAGSPVEEHAGLADPGSAPRETWLLDGDLAVPAGGGESGWQVLDRFAAALAEIAERHRGQTVAVVAAGLELPLTSLCAGIAPARAYASPLEPGRVALVEYDADGWRRVSGWPA
jgi:probable phosphoglycerate mutase